MTTMTKKLTLFAAILGLICFSLVSCGDLLNGIAGGAGGSSSAQSPVVNTPDETSFSKHYGERVTLSIDATVGDGGSLSYQWYKNTSNNRDTATAILGATSASYTVTAPNAEVAKTYYWCKVTNTKAGTTGYNWSYDFDVTVSNIIRLRGEYHDRRHVFSVDCRCANVVAYPRGIQPDYFRSNSDAGVPVLPGT